MSRNYTQAVALLEGLVALPSLAREEAAASAWLVGQMTAAGYDRAFVDEAGNAVGEMGPADAARLVVLLGHIDTVPGNIPVRIEETPDGPVLYGRGSVDAKGPLATATVAVARLGSAWAHAQNVRLVVVGAVEEEAASSKGARFIRNRFDGMREPMPDACIIGEPSGWSRVTLGYKGRILVEMEASQPMAHTAGPDAGVATVAVDFWNWLSVYAAAFNQGRDKAFEQLLPSLRRLETFTDDAMHDHVIASSGIRLPLDFDADLFAADAALVGSIARDSRTQRGLPTPKEPSDKDAYRYLEKKKLDPEKEITLRVYLWWEANDQWRKRSAQEQFPRPRPSFSKQERANLLRLAGLLDEHQPAERLLRAEIARELGEFDRCVAILEGFDSPVAGLIRSLAEQRDARVRAIELER